MKRRFLQELDDNFTAEANDVVVCQNKSVLDVKFKKKVMCDLLTCPLCFGFFSDATTITECLHTFCRSCIYYHCMRGERKCPTCDETMPVLWETGIVSDPRIQQIVDKVFPDLRVREAEFAEFVKDALAGNQMVSIGSRDARQIVEQEQTQNSCDVANDEFFRFINSPPDFNKTIAPCFERMLCLELQPFHSSLPSLPNDCIFCPFSTTVADLATYVTNRLPKVKNQTSISVELLFKDQILHRSHSLEFAIRSNRVSGNLEQYRFAFRYAIVREK